MGYGNTEIQNKETIFRTEKNADGSPVQALVKDGESTHETHNKETLFGTEKNADGTPVKEVTSTD